MSLRPSVRQARRPMTDVDRYDQVAQAAAAGVLRGYSTSFGLACRLLGPTRPGPRPQRLRARAGGGRGRRRPRSPAGLPPTSRALLDGLEQETGDALATRLQREPRRPRLRAHGAGVRHRRRPGHALLRLDAHRPDRARSTTRRASSATCYGSAEVVGLMCLQVFLGDEPRHDPPGTTRSRPAPGAWAPPSRR